jgi:anti-anti-sigma factor
VWRERSTEQDKARDRTGQAVTPPAQSTDSDTRVHSAVAAGQFTVSSDRRGDACVVAVTGELDLSNVDAVAETLQAAEATAATQIVLDFSSLNFIDSTGVQLVIGAMRRAAAHGRQLNLRRGPPQVQRIFEISGVNAKLSFVE